MRDEVNDAPDGVSHEDTGHAPRLARRSIHDRHTSLLYSAKCLADVTDLDGQIRNPLAGAPSLATLI